MNAIKRDQIKKLMKEALETSKKSAQLYNHLRDIYYDDAIWTEEK